MAAGQALQNICLVSRGGGSGSGCLRLTYWILVFSASQLLLCLLPDINSLSVVTALGAATTLGFSVLATAGAAVQGEAVSALAGGSGACAGRTLLQC